MPPFLPRKRLRSPSPLAGPCNPPQKTKATAKVSPRKATLFDDLDAGTASARILDSNNAVLEKLAASDDEESSLSSLSEDEFDDVPKRRKLNEDSDEDDENIEFEDVETTALPVPSGPAPSGDLELTLVRDTRVSLTNPLGTKKGPSKIERGIRTHTHQMHVMSLMWANTVRNGWLCDKEVQDILVKQLPQTVVKAVEKWRLKSGLQQKEEIPKSVGKAKGKEKKGKGKEVDSRSQRDWGQPAERSAAGEVDMSHGDPLFKLLELLTKYWKQRFRITAPGLRKIGYMTLENLDGEMKSLGSDFKKGTFDWTLYNSELHGERISGIGEFRQCAKSLEGSRDVAAQLFTALLRGLGLEARMVANLQPLGFGWSQFEEALEKSPRKLRKRQEASLEDESSDEEDEEADSEEPASKPTNNGKGKAISKPKQQSKASKQPGKRKSGANGQKDPPIDISESEGLGASSDDESIVDITPTKKPVQLSLAYDKDLLFPHYWTETLSPVTNKYVPVDPVVLRLVATNANLVEKFEPRGGKADKAKQVTAYIVGHSSDGTAKDVTTRYLKRHMWPGRTKGNRLPVEKVPIYGRNGKVERYEQYDWFKTVMSNYVRGAQKCPRTEADDLEEVTDLKPVKPEKKVVEEGKETLQSYKTSTEFVLERHFKREEALAPGVKYVKMFTIKGKGNDGVEEKVYLRKDVVKCKSMETWHKEGRAPILGEEPLKRVPYRVATTNRRRELAEAEHAAGEKVLQGLYSEAQTDWIIPPPIENGIIPKNNFGNIDLYVDSMLPEGAVHIARRGVVKICKRLGVDYAEAVTGFEFGHRMAVPVITGVVVAEEHEQAVMEEWEKDEAERERKEDDKRTKTALNMWRKMLMGMRIIERVREEYGDEIDDSADTVNPWTNKKRVDIEGEARAKIMAQADEDMAGGFLPEGHNEEEPDHRPAGFFPVFHEGDDENDGGFVVEGHDEPERPTLNQKLEYATPQSLESSAKTHPTSGKDQEMEGAEPEAPAPAPKKRGRQSGSLNKVTKPKSAAKPMTPTKRAAQKKTRTSRIAGERTVEVENSEQDDEDEESSLSELESDSELEKVPKKVAKKATRRRATLPPKSESARKALKRGTARKSESALRSHYFENGDDEDDR